MSEENLSLKESIAKAVETLGQEEETNDQHTEDKTTKTDSSTEKETKVDNKDNKSTESSSDVEITETPEQLQQALNIRRTLSDPQSAKAFITQLAKDVGLEIKETEIKPKEAAATIIDKLKTALGEENEDLALRLAPVLEDLLKDAVKPSENLKLEQQIREAKQEVDDVFAKLSNELPDFDKLANEMDIIMKTVAPAKGAQMETYLRQIYRLAGGKESQSSSSSKETSSKDPKKEKLKEIEKISKNAKETKENVSSDVEEERTTTSERLTLKQSVAKAVKELQGK